MVGKKTLCFIFLVLLVFVNCSNFEENIDNRVENVKFCDLFNNINDYKFKTVETKAIMLGFHDFILYDENCFDAEHTVSLEFSKISRQQLIQIAETLGEKIYYNHNLYGQIKFIGKLSENENSGSNIESDPHKQEFPYKFTVIEVKELSPLEKKILPGE